MKHNGKDPAKSPEAAASDKIDALLGANTARSSVPEEAVRFPVDEEVDAGSLVAELMAEMERLSAAAADDPFHNPILALARDLSRRLDQGALSYSALEQAIQYLTAEGFRHRAARLGRYLGAVDPDENAATLRRLIHGLAASESGAGVDFDEFRRLIEREAFGIVVTAHPTFNISGELMTVLAELGTGRDADDAILDATAIEARLQTVLCREHRPEPMTLEREHELSLVAVANIHRAMRRAYEAVFDVAEILYPARWTELTPRLLTVASWVGYDLDGRSDIGWTDTLHKRLEGQAMRLRLTLDETAAMRAMAADEPRETAVAEILDELTLRLSVALDEITAEMTVFGETADHDDAVRNRIQSISKSIVGGLEYRLTESGGLVGLLERAVKQTDSRAIRRRLLVLRAELANSGLGMAHVHVRINASQLHNAVRKAVGLESAPDDPRYRVSYLARLDELLEQTEPATVNFGSILAEQTSARRLFMVIAQMLKFVDGTTPVRFLIAECESPFTALVALYYARLFGVADKIDISPLFETQRALEVGSRVINQLLDNRHFRDYVRRRGRICVQTGYSDAGRYIGQIPAAASIERFRHRLARVLQAHGLEGVDVVIFDTHGESVGRGGHPASLTDRLAYVDTPATRHAFLEAGVDITEEVSFQGGDGYLYFMNPAGALAAVTRILEHALRPPPVDEDLFYEEADYIRETFTVVTQFQVDLMRDPDYGALLGTFAPNLLYPSGSRAVVRQREIAESETIGYAAEIRAIPHNASLAQLGVLANAVGGLGSAVDKDPARFMELYRASPRLRALMGIAEYALAVSNFDVLTAYVATLDPGQWLARARATPDRQRSERMREIADVLERSDLHDRLDRIVRRLARDVIAFYQGLADLSEDGGLPGSARLVDERTRIALALLHAVRIALIHEIFLLTTCVPDFAPQLGTTRERVVLRLLHLDVPMAVSALEKVFPAVPKDPVDAQDFGEPASYRGEESQTYEAENAEIFRPLSGLHALIRRVSSAITHYVGFFG